MKFDSDFFCALDLEKTHGPIAIVTHFGVGGVVADDNVVFVGEIDHSFKELFIRHRSSWIIGIVDPEKLCLFCHLGGIESSCGRK